jgi:hypothetical protein
MGARTTYLSTVTVALDLLGHPAVHAAWDQPSALEGWRVSGLAGHLARAVTTVEQYLDGDEAPAGELVTPGGYYARVIPTDDPESDLHRSIRRRGDEMASEGATRLHEKAASTAERLRNRLALEPAGRRMSVLDGVVLSLDDYLATRVVELVVHSDDLAMSAGIATPAFSAEAYRLAAEALVDTARQRHGDLAVIRALTRRERDAVHALRVF